MSSPSPSPFLPAGGDVVTGEAVVLELRLAKFPSRTLSILVDLTVQLTVLVALLLLLAAASGSVDPALARALGLVVTVAVIVGYPTTLEWLTGGRTLGKFALGLRVVRDDGGPIRFRHALARGLVAVVEIWLTFGVVAILTSLVSDRGKRVGDYAAGTVVVRERAPAQGAPLAVMPPGWEGWAATLDLSRLTDDLALHVRQFLSRAPQLAPATRERLGRELGAAVAAQVRPPPPPHCHPETYLAAVLAERRHRAAGTANH